jgi:hypothetical protein
MKFLLKITPMINPKIRHRIEDTLVSCGYDIIGGGQGMINGSFSSISFEGSNPRDYVSPDSNEVNDTFSNLAIGMAKENLKR